MSDVTVRNLTPNGVTPMEVAGKGAAILLSGRERGSAIRGIRPVPPNNCTALGGRLGVRRLVAITAGDISGYSRLMGWTRKERWRE